MDKVDIIIPAAGIGAIGRYAICKPLLKLTPQITLLEHQVSMYSSLSRVGRIIIVAGFKLEQISKKILNNSKVTIVANPLYTTHHIGESIACGIRELDSDNIMMLSYGDLFLCKKTIQTFLNKKISKLLVNTNTSKTTDVGIFSLEDRVSNLLWCHKKKWGQLAMFTNLEKQLLQELCQEDQQKRYGFELINDIIDAGGMFIEESTKDLIIDVDTNIELNKAKKAYGSIY